MAPILLNVFLAGIPTVLILFFFLRRDERKKESPVYIWRAFVLGFAALIPAALVELLLTVAPMQLQGLFRKLFEAYVVSGFVEEGTKLLVVLLFVYRQPYFDEESDGIIYAVTASMGLAFFENILYSFGPVQDLIMRGITAVPLHAIATGTMGYFIGKSRFGDRSYLSIGLFAAVAIHGTYNLLLFLGGWLTLLVIPLLLGAGTLLLRLYRRAIQDDIDAERL
ncbi:PrsW family intramembrane metalloprotease [Salinispira pacifica]